MLIVLLKQKDNNAFNYLYDNYSGALYGIILKIVSDEELAQDILQETFVKIWQAIDSYDEKKGRLFTWILNIARNKAIDKLRSKKVRPEIQSIDLNVYFNHNPSFTNVNKIGVKDIVNNLNPDYKKIIDAIYFCGYTHEETSKVLDIPLGTVKTRARAALKELRKYFNLLINLWI